MLNSDAMNKRHILIKQAVSVFWKMRIQIKSIHLISDYIDTSEIELTTAAILLTNQSPLTGTSLIWVCSENTSLIPSQSSCIEQG
jgi:hypothetical protein